eukprot:sb/3478506/
MPAAENVGTESKNIFKQKRKYRTTSSEVYVTCSFNFQERRTIPCRVANGPILPLTDGLAGGIEIMQLLPEVEVEGNAGTTAFVDATPEFVADLDDRAWNP